LLTHCSTAMTQRYAHLSNESLKRAAATADIVLHTRETTNVAINVYPRYIWSESYSISYETGTIVASWSRPETTIPAKLVLYYYNVNSSGDGPITATYECSGTSMNLSQPMISCEETISLRLAFEEFNITTGSLVSYSVGGCK